MASRSNAVTIGGLVILVIFAWAYLISGAGMPAMPGMAASPGFGALAFMWWVMMVAMMIPAASPTVLLYSHVHRSSGLRSEAPTAAFLAGYLICWLGFALIAAGLQSWLISPVSMAIASDNAVAGLLIAAGLYQLSPFKDSCLGKCRSPAEFLSRHYRPGRMGALRLGVLHGAFCVGCCWLLMALLFIGGVMNLVWVAGLATLVAAEKLLPRGRLLAKLAGVILILWGTASLLA